MRLTVAFDGSAHFMSSLQENHHRLLVSVRCKIGGLSPSFDALLDTGAEWCVLRPEVAEALGYDPTPDPDVPGLLTRFGTMRGRLVRVPFRFEAEDGDQLDVDTTSFIATDWPGPVVIGWRGCLERIRFALDPNNNLFYFGGFE